LIATLTKNAVKYWNKEVMALAVQLEYYLGLVILPDGEALIEAQSSSFVGRFSKSCERRKHGIPAIVSK